MSDETRQSGARTSVWGSGAWLEPSRREEVRDLALELEALGYHRIWVGGGQQPGVADLFGDLLETTSSIGLATGILNIWVNDPGATAREVAAFEAAHPGRFLLGVGTSHAPMVEGSGQDYTRPYGKVVDWLDGLDATGVGAAAADRRALAALGPRMLRLARDRSVGAHPYFTTPEHTRFARETLGAGPLLAPEVAVVLETDAELARATAHTYMTRYLALPNYTQNLRRFGWGDDDLQGGGSDRLLDALIPWGDVDAVAAGVRQHVDAGADEVVVQVLPTDPTRIPTDEFRRLAAALT